MPTKVQTTTTPHEPEPGTEAARLRFGLFEFDPRTGLLTREGKRCNLRPQQAQALALLLSRNGNVVSREDLREQLWGRETFVDFEAGLNTCIRRLRAALGEEAGEPRYVQTIPGRGYRFIAPISRERAAGVSASRFPSASASETDTPVRRFRARSFHRYRWVAVPIVAGILLVLAFYLPIDLRRAGESALPAGDARLVLLGNFDVASGDSLVDAALEEAFRIGLSQRAELQMVAPAEVRATLERMELEPTAEVDREVGTEICQRLGANALILGGVQRVGNRLALHVEVVDAESGRTVAARSSLTEDQEELLSELGDLVEQLHEALGGYLSTQASARRLAKVTTSNLEALKAYSRALQLDKRDPIRIALLRRATTLDPEFAMAHSKLGVAEVTMGRSETAIRHFREAANNSARLTEFESLYVDGHVAMLAMDGVEAVRAWSIMTEAFPDLKVGYVNLGAALLFFRNDFVRCAETLRRAPKPPQTAAAISDTDRNLIVCLLGAGRLEEALNLVARHDRHDPTGSASLAVGPMLALKRHAEAEQALIHAERSGQLERTQSDLERALIYADQLHLDSAVEALQQVIERSSERGPLARLAYRLKLFSYLEAAGLDQQLRAGLARAFSEVRASREWGNRETGAKAVPALALLGVLAARNGSLQLALEIQDWTLAHTTANRGNSLWRAHLVLLEAEILGARGRHVEAADRLRRLVNAGPVYPLHARASLARAYEATRETEAAAAEHRFLTEQRGRALVECLGGSYCVDDALNLLAVGDAERFLGDRSDT